MGRGVRRGVGRGGEGSEERRGVGRGGEGRGGEEKEGKWEEEGRGFR